MSSSPPEKHIGKDPWFSDGEEISLDDDNLEQLREEQGILSVPEVDVPPEYESDDDIAIPDHQAMNSFDNSGSLNIQNRSETRQNRNLTTGSASSERPLSSKLSAADTIEQGETLDDFEEEERRIQKEFESSGEMTDNLGASIQNRQESVMTDYPVRQKTEEYESDSDYPDGGNFGMEYPTDPPPAYASPPKSPELARKQQKQDHYESDDDEEGYKKQEKSYFANRTPSGGIGALVAGGVALAGSGMPSYVSRDDEQESHYEDLDERSSQESFHYNDAIRDQSPIDRVGQLPPMQLTSSQPTSPPKVDVEDESPKRAVYAITNDLKNLLHYVEQYQAQNVEVEPFLVPFDVNFVPAVGDVHPGVNIPRPDGINDYLGYVVLDEPAAVQSSSTVMNMLLKSGAGGGKSDEPVKMIYRPDKNSKAIEQWIDSIKEVRRSKPVDRMNYSKPMPDIEKLMEEWSPEFDQILHENKLPTAHLDATTEEFADLCLAYADIPVHGSRIQSLHLLFSLYNEFKNSQHFRNSAYAAGSHHNTETDRLEL